MSTLAIGEKLLSLLDQAATSSTYKPALLLSLMDRVQDREIGEPIPVRDLAERVAELYWPQTVAYPTTGHVLLQNQAGGQARIVRVLADLRRAESVPSSRTLAPVRGSDRWPRALDQIETSLAEMPIPRLQEPFEPFLYDFDWQWAGTGGWSARAYRQGTRAIGLRPGVAESLISLGPLLRPFIVRWWTEKAAHLNRQALPDARALVDFEEFLFGADRATLTRLAGDLTDLQAGDCFYCGARMGRVEVDHFVPWSHSGDDGIDNLVAACRPCNQDKRAALAAPEHLSELLGRNRTWNADLEVIADTKRWPRHPDRSLAITRNAYLRGPEERPIWLSVASGVGCLDMVGHRRADLEMLLSS